MQPIQGNDLSVDWLHNTSGYNSACFDWLMFLGWLKGCLSIEHCMRSRAHTLSQHEYLVIAIHVVDGVEGKLLRFLKSIL